MPLESEPLKKNLNEYMFILCGNQFLFDIHCTSGVGCGSSPPIVAPEEEGTGGPGEGSGVSGPGEGLWRGLKDGGTVYNHRVLIYTYVFDRFNIG